MIFVTFNDLGGLYFMKFFCLNNVSFHGNVYQNRFINKYARKKKATISESWSLRVMEFFSEI